MAPTKKTLKVPARALAPAPLARKKSLVTVPGNSPAEVEQKLKARQAKDERRDLIAAGPGKKTMPWNETSARDDLRLAMHMRMPERLIIKLSWLSAYLDRPRRDIVEEALESVLDAELTRLGYEP